MKEKKRKGEEKNRRRNCCGQTDRWKSKKYKRSSHTYENGELERNIPMQLCTGECVCGGKAKTFTITSLPLL